MVLSNDIEEFNLAFLDLETTGLHAVTGDSICEIGVLKVKQRKIIDQLQQLINPKRNIPYGAYQVHKISDEDVKDAPFFEDIAVRLVSFCDSCVICAYNVGFDAGFVNHHLQKMGKEPLENPAIDILAMARDALTLPKYNLAAVAKFFNIDCSNGLHRALDDALIAYKVFFNLLDIFKEKGVRKLGDFLSLYGFNNELVKAKENKKIDILKNAINNKVSLKAKVFSLRNVVEQETIMPLRIVQENRYISLLYQNINQDPVRIKLNRILEIESKERV